MSTTHLAPIEPGNRIELPAHSAKDLGLGGPVALERTSEGILVRPGPAKGWDEFFATKLRIGSAPADKDDDFEELRGDDLLF
jgi:hypothetical protein